MKKLFAPIPQHVEKLATAVIDSAFQIHQTLGPGLLESVYECCLHKELLDRGIPFESQVFVPIEYRGMRLTTELKLDLLVDNALIVEIKAVETLLPVHQAQLLTYLKLKKVRLGLLINFDVALFKEGIKRVVN